MATPNTDDGAVNQKDHLEVLAKTGHESLKAFLITSAGAVAVLLGFLGTILASDKNNAAIASVVIAGFLGALKFFILAVGTSLAAFGFSFASHACYYKLKLRAGDVLTLLAALCCISCMVLLIWGGFEASKGLKSAADMKTAEEQAAKSTKSSNASPATNPPAEISPK